MSFPTAFAARCRLPVMAALALAGAPLGLIPATGGAARAAAIETNPVAEGILRLRSAHGVDETLARLKAAVDAKGVRFFGAIDQSDLGNDAGVSVGRSTLVLFGNPPLGLQFLQANPYAGLDWPVRMLVVQESDGSVWLAWTDFGYLARRYHITDRPAQLKMATEVAASIATDAAR